MDARERAAKDVCSQQPVCGQNEGAAVLPPSQLERWPVWREQARTRLAALSPPESLACVANVVTASKSSPIERGRC